VSPENERRAAVRCRLTALLAKNHVLPALNCSSLGASAMLDIVVLAIGLAFFALSVGYTIACDRL
jgi:hypothetical protein